MPRRIRQAQALPMGEQSPVHGPGFVSKPRPMAGPLRGDYTDGAMKTTGSSQFTRRLAPAVTAIFITLGTTALFAQDQPAYPSPDPQPQTPRENPPGTTPDRDGSNVKWTESHFLRKVAETGDDDIRISTIAAQRASRPDVKTFAERVIQHRRSENAALTALAAQKGVELSTPTGPRLEKKWSEKDAKDFDADYVDKMIDDYESDVKAYEKRATSDDPQIAAQARNGLPALQEHLRLARDLKKSLEASK
jgi:putative membrane protein